MNKNYETLELHKILEMLADHCSNEKTREMALSIVPSDDLYTVQREINKTVCAFDLSVKYGTPVFYGMKDISAALKRADAGAVLSLKELLETSDGSVVVSDAQAELISGVCELYARVRMGQFKEIIWYFLDMKLSSEDYCERRDEAEQLLLKARESIYPDLHGIGHSYGIGKFEDADKVYDVHQVIRYARGHWREPFSYYPVPKCTVVNGT